MTEEKLTELLTDVKNKQDACGYVYTTEEEFKELQQVYMEQVRPVTTIEQARSNNERKLIELRAFYESAIKPMFAEQRLIHDIGYERVKEERQAKFPDVDFGNVEYWKPEYNLDLDSPPSEYELMLMEAHEENVAKLVMRIPGVIDEIIGKRPGICTITKDGEERQCRTDKLYPWVLHGWSIVPSQESADGR